MEAMPRRRISDDTIAVIGLGAMIIFIATVIVAITVGAVVVGMHEKISQKTTQTLEDTRRDSVNTVIIVGGWVYDDYDDMLFMMEFGSSGEDVARIDVIYTLSCTDSSGVYYYRSDPLGESGGSAIYVWHVGDVGPRDAGYPGNVNNFAPGERYFFTLDGGTNAVPGGDECGPSWMNTEGASTTMWLHLPNGMSTYQELTLSNGQVVGSAIV